MKNYLYQSVKSYLDSSDIPYAILLNGKWGTGKTWFIKNKLEEELKCKIIYTSAFKTLHN